MSGTIKPSQALKIDPEFFKKRSPDINWTLVVNDGNSTKTFVGVDWYAVSRFGKVENVVVTNKNGKPLFDRPAYSEAPNVNVVAWGKDKKTGEIKVAVISEERPHADHPDLPESTEPLKFAQIPMGFLNKILGKGGYAILEAKKKGAGREVSEETGASAIIEITRPPSPWQNPNPAFVATWSELFFVQVDLEKISELKLDGDELIYKAEYLSIPDLLKRIKEGQNSSGEIFRAATSLSALMIFFACHPEFWPQ